MTEDTFRTLTLEVVEQATSGDASALDRILTLLSRPFYNLALRMLQNHQDAEDASQESLIRVATKLSTFKGKSEFSTWAWTVATRCILDYREGMARRARITVDGFTTDLMDGLEMADDDDPENRLYLSQVKLGCGRAMLQVLDGDHRLAYTLSEIMGLEQSEAAAAVGVSAATFRKRVSRARLRVRELLKRNCGIVADANTCRCRGRRARAMELNRLEPRDAVVLDIGALSRQIQEVDELSRTSAFFQADPAASPSERLLPRVKEILRLS